MRYAFGPQVTGNFPPSVVQAGLPDVEVTASVKGVRAADGGLADVQFSIVIPAYDPSTVNPLLEVHAIAFGPSDGLPTTPEAAIAALHPKAMQDITGQVAGVEVLLTILGCPSPQSIFLTVLGFPDATPAASPIPGAVAPTTTG